MNAIVPAKPTSSNALVPQTMEQAFRLADMMASQKLVPKHLQGSPGDCLMVVEQAMRWNMSPFAVAQATSLVQGKMMYEGKLVAAAVETMGAITGWMDYVFTGENGNRAVIASATRRGESSPREVEVTLAEAKTANQWWSKMPDQMLVYHAARVWARRWTPSVILGVYSPEEMSAAEVDTFTGTTLDAQPELARAASVRKPDVVDADAIPALDGPAPDKQADATTRLIARIEACAAEDDLHVISGDVAIQTWRTKLAKARPELDTRIADAFGAKYDALIAARPDVPDEAPPVAEPVTSSDEVPF